jgi:methylglutaconyl-CoA hydratase
MIYETLVSTKKDDVATVTLNRPDVHNAMNAQLIKELTQCFHHLSGDDSVSAIVLTGNGKSFCAGADLSWMKQMVKYSKEENQSDSQILLDMYETINSCAKPLIGRVNGHAFGGGIGLFAVCDITIAVPELKFGFSEVKLGIIPAVISTFIAQRMKPSDMRRFFITGERFDTRIAHDIGLIDLVVDAEKLDDAVTSCVEQLHSSGPLAVKECKQLIANLLTMEKGAYKQFTVEKISELRVSREGQEGITAFLEKRKPNWKE